MQPKPITYTRAPEEKRKRLLAAARTLFVKQGFDATSTREIASAAGVSEGILFHHFGSKKGLFDCIADEFVEAGALAAMPPEASDLTEEAVVRAAFDFADAHPALYRLLARAGSELDESEAAARGDAIVGAIRQKLEAGMLEGKVRSGNPQIMAQLQFALVDAAYKAWLRSGDPGLREIYIREAISCMKAMLAPTAGHPAAGGAPETEGEHDE